MKKIDFYFDFASPNAYLANKVIKKIKEKTGAEVNYIPVLLGGIFKSTNNKPPMEQFFVDLKIKTNTKTSKCNVSLIDMILRTLK